MPLTLMVAPMVVEEAKSYAEEKGTTLDLLVQSFFEDLVARERKRRAANAELAELAGSWVEDPEMGKALAEMRTIDEEMWK